MKQLIWKNKVVVLWVLQMMNFSAVLLMPEVSVIVAAEVGETLGPLIAFYFFMTALMMWITVAAKPALSRWPIILVGVFYGFVKIQWIVSTLTGEMVPQLLFNELWGLIAAAMIIWFGWKVPGSEG